MGTCSKGMKQCRACGSSSTRMLFEVEQRRVRRCSDVHACLPGCGSRCSVHSQHVLHLRQWRAKPLLCRHRPRGGDTPGWILAALQGCLCKTTIASCICSMSVVATVLCWDERNRLVSWQRASRSQQRLASLVKDQFQCEVHQQLACGTGASRIELRCRDDVRLD